MAKHLPWFKPFKGVLLTICLSILTALPAAAAQSPAAETTQPSPEEIKVLQPSIVIPTSTDLYLSSLIENGVVEGIVGGNSDYSIKSSVTNNVSINNNGYITFYGPLTTTVTYTHKEFPEVKFSIDVTAKRGPSSYISQNIATLYIGKPQSFLIPDDYLPLSDFIVEKYRGGSNTADFNYAVEGNTLTLEGTSEGVVYLRFSHKFGVHYYYSLKVANPPSDINVKVLKDLIIPVNQLIYPEKLISGNVIEGIAIQNRDYFISSSDSSIVDINKNGYFTFTSTGTADLTFVNKSLPELNFTVTVVAKGNTGRYLYQQLLNPSLPYVGESKTILIPDDYVPLTDYIITHNYFGNENKDDSCLVISEDGKRITFKYTTAGRRTLYRIYPDIGSGGAMSMAASGFIIKTREVAAEIDNEGEVTAGAQIGVPVTIDLQKDILNFEEGEKIVWESKNDDIASVNYNTGEITPLKLGKTTIIVKKVLDSSATPLSRAGGTEEDALLTIEFWVTELEMAVDRTISAGSREKLTFNVNAGDEKYPDDIDLKPSWTTSNTDVATVNEGGILSALSEGTAVITLTTAIGTKEMVVEVVPGDTPVESLSINPSDVALTVGSRMSLSTSGAGDKSVKWTTSNSFVARVDENGVVTAEAPGQALITATVEGTSLKATIMVTVFEKTTGIEGVSDDTTVESVTYFDLQGRRVSAEARGMLIERIVLTDGVILNRKIRK